MSKNLEVQQSERNPVETELAKPESKSSKNLKRRELDHDKENVIPKSAKMTTEIISEK